MLDINQRVTAIESIFAKVNLGDWSNDQEVPIWLAWRILPALELQASLMSAVHLAAQVKMSQGPQVEGGGRLMSEIIDDWCGTPPRRHGPPRPHWGTVVKQLGDLADRYPAGSMLREAAFDLSNRVVTRAHELGQAAK